MQEPQSQAMLIRPAVPGDEMGVARVHVRSWQEGYRGLLSPGYLNSLRPEDRARRYTFGEASSSPHRTLVAIESGVIRGFATIGHSQDDGREITAELNALYVDPDRWGRRMGAALETAARDLLIELGYRNAFLWVLAGNVRAIGFYESQGWASDGSTREAEVWGIRVNESRFIRALGADLA